MLRLAFLKGTMSASVHDGQKTEPSPAKRLAESVPPSPQHLASPPLPALPSLIRGKFADATLSHSGDSCAQGCCDVPPGPWPPLAGELSLTSPLKLVLPQSSVSGWGGGREGTQRGH